MLTSSKFTLFISSHKILGQKAQLFISLLIYENFKACRKHFISITPRPLTFSETFEWSLETLSGLLPHGKLKMKFSNCFSCTEFKSGKTKGKL